MKIEELRALEKAATRGWNRRGNFITRESGTHHDILVGDFACDADTDLAVAMRNALPALLKIAEASAAEVLAGVRSAAKDRERLRVALLNTSALRVVIEDFIHYSAPLADLAQSQWASVTGMPNGQLSQITHWLNVTSKEARAALDAGGAEHAG